MKWRQFGTAVACGLDSISVTPDLPPGIVLPNGVDPEEISDPALREQAREMAVRHSEAVERWNARQRALGHLHRLATLLRATRPISETMKTHRKSLLPQCAWRPDCHPRCKSCLRTTQSKPSAPAFGRSDVPLGSPCAPPLPPAAAHANKPSAE